MLFLKQKLARQSLVLVLLAIEILACTNRPFAIHSDQKSSSSGRAQGTTNYLKMNFSIVDTDGKGHSDRPFFVLGSFPQGKVKKYPGVALGGQPLLSQANVRSRWSDGSVRNALIAFHASIPKNSESLFEFVEVDSCNCDTKSAVQLDFLKSKAFKHDLQVTLRSQQIKGESLSFSLKNFIAQTTQISSDPQSFGPRYWVSGPLMSEIILEDRSPELRYDGTVKAKTGSEYKGFNLHPIFLVTYFPKTDQTKIEFILENSALQNRIDLTYNIEISNGANVLYNKTAYVHKTNTKWRRIFWMSPNSGSLTSNQASNVFVDYNLANLVAAGAVPRYDAGLRLNADSIRAAFEEFPDSTQCGNSISWKAIESDPEISKRFNDIDGYRQWCQSMPSPGGRPDLGLIPGFYARYLFAMKERSPSSYRLWRQFIGNAEAAGLLAVHFRENFYSERKYLSNRSENAWGRFVSLGARPTATFQTVSDADPNDSIGYVEQLGYPWVEQAHIPSISYIPYILTGDYYFYESVLATASFSLVHRGLFDRYRYRNPNVAGIVRDEYRGQAWAIRDISNAYAVAFGGSPEEEYMKQKLLQNIEVRLGRLGFKGPRTNCPSKVDRYSEKDPYCYGTLEWDIAGSEKELSKYFQSQNPMNFGYLDRIPEGTVFPGVDPSKADGVISIFMLSYMITSLDQASRFGIPEAKTLSVALARPLVFFANEMPKALGGYYLPVHFRDSFFTNTNSILDAMGREFYAKLADPNFSDPQSGYFTLARAALASVANESPSAWKVINAPTKESFRFDPRWAIEP